MGARKVFYPITDDALIGVLNDFDVVLKGMMPYRSTELKGIMQNSNAVLNGNLRNSESVLPGVTDIFPYVEYLTLRGSFVVSAHELLLTLIQSIELTGSISLDCSVTDVSGTKNLGNLSDALIVNSVIDVAMSKAVEASGAVSFAQDAEIAICKDLGDVSESLYLDGDISEITATLIQRVVASLIFDGEIRDIFLRKDLGELTGGITLDCSVTDVSDTKDLGDLTGRFRLSDALNLTLVKSVLPQNADLFIDGEMEVQSVRYRKLGDLEGLTFADAADWTLYDFYYKEE